MSIVRLVHPECSGDWHDKPLKWGVYGPGKEVQKFATKREAREYMVLRRRSASDTEAIHNFAVDV